MSRFSFVLFLFAGCQSEDVTPRQGLQAAEVDAAEPDGAIDASAEDAAEDAAFLDDADATDVDATDVPLTFDAVYGTIITARCSCHTFGLSGRLNMSTADTAYASLVDHATSDSGMCAGEKRVVPGDPDSSVLYRKITGMHLCGSRMPLGAPEEREPLSDAEVTLLRDWIVAGAPR